MASIGNLQEISSGQLAAQKGQRPDVRSFGKMMISDHGKAQQQLMQLANSKHMNIPQEATTGIQADLKLKNAGSNFDALYVHNMVADHRTTVQMFENYAETGKDPDVRALAKQMLPILKQHLAEIITIEKQLNAEMK